MQFMLMFLAMHAQQESNPHPEIRNLVPYPLCYGRWNPRADYEIHRSQPLGRGDVPSRTGFSHFRTGLFGTRCR